MHSWDKWGLRMTCLLCIYFRRRGRKVCESRQFFQLLLFRSFSFQRLSCLRTFQPPLSWKASVKPLFITYVKDNYIRRILIFLATRKLWTDLYDACRPQMNTFVQIRWKRSKRILSSTKTKIFTSRFLVSFHEFEIHFLFLVESILRRTCFVSELKLKSWAARSGSGNKIN